MEIPVIYETIIGISAGVFTAVSMLPQLVKIIREKKAENISLAMLSILITGLALWVLYGFIKKDLPILCTNAFSLLVNGLVMAFSIAYKNKPATRTHYSLHKTGKYD